MMKKTVMPEPTMAQGVAQAWTQNAKKTANPTTRTAEAPMPAKSAIPARPIMGKTTR